LLEQVLGVSKISFLELDHRLVELKHGQIVSGPLGCFGQLQPAPLQVSLPEALVGLLNHLAVGLATGDEQN
jgi:hypothetical protein